MTCEVLIVHASIRKGPIITFEVKNTNRPTNLRSKSLGMLKIDSSFWHMCSDLDHSDSLWVLVIKYATKVSPRMKNPSRRVELITLTSNDSLERKYISYSETFTLFLR